MALKRRQKISPSFSMSSMTDLIFLLLIFFMITSTMVSPNAIKVLLPQGSEQTSAKPMARVIIDKDLNYYGAFGNEDEMPLAIDEVTAFLQECARKEPEMYVALYADESIPYREIVRVLNIANENHFKMVLATRRPDKNLNRVTLKKNKVIGIVCTVALHVLLLLLLFLLKLTVPTEQEEGGVPVMLGNTELAAGDADPYTMTEVDVMPSEVPSSAPEAAVEPEVEQPMITQQDEPSLQVKKEKPKTETKKEQPKKTPVKTETQKVNKPKEKTEAEKRAEAEKAAAQAAANAIAGAFGKGSQMGSKGNAAGAGLQGSPTGNSSTGKTSGVGGYGTFDLNGRTLGGGKLPVPVYNVQDEGRVVVTIVVNPAGQVISTSINKRTSTVNPALRRAAEEAARKARFNAVDGVNNQSGTITYYFKLK